MNTKIFSSSDYEPQVVSFFNDSFLSGEKNEGYRYFPK